MTEAQGTEDLLPELAARGSTVHRRTARVLPLDQADRCLLMHGWEPDSPDSPFWFTIGGAVENGESLAVAAVRELREETGLAIDPDQLVGPVAQSRITFDWAGIHVVQHQTFFAVRVADDAAGGVTLHGLDAWERRTIDGFAWWALDDLIADGTAGHPSILEAIRAALRALG